MKIKIIIFLFIFFIPHDIFSLIYPITPRYLSLKKDKVHMRYNASFEAPISFVYQKKGFPVLLIDENGNWRKIRDIDGIEGWIHQSMLSNKKAFINQKQQNLIKYLENKNLIVAIVNKNVVGRILTCEKEYCKVKINNYKGWLKKEFLWGIKKN